MTSHRYTSITCDGGGGHFMCTTPEYFAGLGEGVTEARRYLREIGWRYVPGHRGARGGRDLCPEHAHETDGE